MINSHYFLLLGATFLHSSTSAYNAIVYARIAAQFIIGEKVAIPDDNGTGGCNYQFHVPDFVRFFAIYLPLKTFVL